MLFLTYRRISSPSEKWLRFSETTKCNLACISLYSGHHRNLKIVFVIERCPLHRGSSQIGLF